MSLLERRLRWQQMQKQIDPRPALKVAVLATFTANPLEPYLGTALAGADLPPVIFTGPYNQVAQECLADQSETARFRPDVLLVWPRLEDLWSGRPWPLTDPSAAPIREAVELAETCLDAARRWGATLLFVLPAIPDLRPLGVGDISMVTGVAATATAVREALRQRLAGQKGALLADGEEAVRQVGTGKAFDPRKMALARIPYSEELLQSVGDQAARIITLSRRAARKVVVVDADNTLWGGVVGEDGPDGVKLGDNGPGEAYRDFQSYLLELRRSGVLLALASKNQESDVQMVFRRREMRLKQEHLAAMRVGWQPKSVSIREMAEELQLGLDAFVLIDDSPAEVAEVSSSLPQVACIRFPADPAEWLAAVAGSGLLDRLPPTAEDLQRAGFYQQERERNLVLAAAASPEEYRAQLGVAVEVFAPASGDMARFAQLVAKTNQFNLNCRRRSESELAALCADPDYVVRLVQARDRYGDYGIVGAMVARVEGGQAELDTFLLSCRAMGRGVEEAMLAGLREELDQRGVTELHATVLQCPRNEPAYRFFAPLGCACYGEPAVLPRVDWPAYVGRLQPV